MKIFGHIFWVPNVTRFCLSMFIDILLLSESYYKAIVSSFASSFRTILEISENSCQATMTLFDRYCQTILTFSEFKLNNTHTFRELLPSN